MAISNPWSVIHAERKDLLADLEGLSDDQWKTPSLCAGWTVKDVLGHMIATARMTPGKFFPKLIGSGFNFNSFTAKEVARETAGSPADTLNRFREILGATSHPPGPNDSWVGESIIHAEDIRRPLGVAHSYPSDAVVGVADFYKGSNLIVGAKKRIAGLTLKATDAEWSTGSGPEVSGPILSLVLAMTGRRAAVADLAGEGVNTLQGRSA